jgi:NitT/TauT family transport system substrate-binding protein
MEDFAQYYPLLLAIARRMLGSAGDVEDVVQESYLLSALAASDTLTSLRAYVMTIVTHLCLDQLKSARLRREQSLESKEPQSLVAADMEEAVLRTFEQHEALSLAFLVLLTCLTPEEQTVFLLREVFAYSYDELADLLGKNPTACRQLFHRARLRLAQRRPRFPVSQEACAQLLDRFLLATSQGTLQRLLDVLESQRSVPASQGAVFQTPTRTTQTTVAIGYLPDVRCAPLYVAQIHGYYRATGLEVAVTYCPETDQLGCLLTHRHTFALASGDEVLMARARHLPVVTVATLFQHCPLCLIVPAASPIRCLADLKGRTIGVPASFGATYTGLLLLLEQAHLSCADVQIRTIGLTQVAALKEQRVDAVMGYTGHEPVLFQKSGVAVRTFAVGESWPLVSNGIVVAEDTLRRAPHLVSAFVQATLRGLLAVVEHPWEAVEASLASLPGGTDAEQALAILQATIPFWQSALLVGSNDQRAWNAMAHALASSSPRTVDHEVLDAAVVDGAGWWSLLWAIE